MRPNINNAFYDELGERWYQDESHPIALLRAESKLKLRYIRETLALYPTPGEVSILDIGCGAGLITIPLAEEGYRIKGVDLSANSIQTATSRAANTPVQFEVGNAYELTDESQRYDVVLMMDFLEHVEEPARALAEAIRVLRPGGTLLCHTFNRTWRANLLAIRAVKFFSRNCPDHVHVYHLFVKPQELKTMAESYGVRLKEFRGLRPDFVSSAFLWSLAHRQVHRDFAFRYCSSLAVGYFAQFRNSEAS